MVSLLIGKKIIISNKEYLIVDSNNNNKDCVSFFNYNTKKYLRHYASKLIESDTDLNAHVFPNDSSFMPELCDKTIFLKVSNPGFNNRYIYKDGDIFKVTPKNVDPEGLKFGFTVDGVDENATGNSLDIKLYSELKEKFLTLEKKYNYEIASSKLRNISNNIRKKDSVVFVGTGKLGENTQYAFMQLNRMKQNEGMEHLELLYFARNKIEKEYFDAINLPCEIWSSKNYSHVRCALQAKVAVFATHTLDNGESNGVLLSCLSGAYRVQLWHGFMAKMVGCATLKNGQAIGHMANMLEDCSVDVVATALNSEEVIKNYETCFPGAEVICTGDARTDALFSDNNNESVDKWCETNKSKIRLLFSPTYRENSAAALAYIDSFVNLCSTIDNKRVAISIKFHPIFFSKLPNEKNKVIEKIEKAGVNIISERDDSYTIMNKFDAMVTDYSSIRIDYALTGKPIVLFRPDHAQYTAARIINPTKEFDLLDSVSYDMEKEDIIDVLEKDSKKESRLEIINKLGMYTDGKSSERVCSVILEHI